MHQIHLKISNSYSEIKGSTNGDELKQRLTERRNTNSSKFITSKCAKNSVLWYVTPCILTVHQHLGEKRCLENVCNKHLKMRIRLHRTAHGFTYQKTGFLTFTTVRGSHLKL